MTPIFGGKKTRVRMLVSVGDIPAGTEPHLPVDQADEYIVKGYAEGRLSREFTPEERNRIRSNMQRVEI